MAHVDHSDWMFEHSSAHAWGTHLDPHTDVAADAGHPAQTDSVASVLKTLWHHTDLMNGGASASGTSAASTGKPVTPTLTVTSAALTVDAGGSVALPVSVTPSQGNHAVSVTIAGLASYETVTDALDHQTFSGPSITLSAAQVNSGLSLASNYTGTDHPVNTLSLTAMDTVGHHAVLSDAQTIVVTDPPVASGSTAAPAPAATTTTTSTSSGNPLTLQVSGDMMNGIDPQIQVFVDGHQAGNASYDITAHHSQGQTQTITIDGNFDPTVAHQVQVKFINDQWDGTSSADGHDVNAYVGSISLNGATINGAQGTNTASNGGVKGSATEAVMDIDGTLAFNVPADPPAVSGSSGGAATGGAGVGGSGASSGTGVGSSGATTGAGGSSALTLQVSGDMFSGDPQIQVYVDGQQAGGTYDITAHHSQGQTQTITIPGNFDPTVAHQVQIKFINDAWDGTSATDGHDRNVYIGAISLNGVTINGSQGTNTASNGGIQATNANEAVMNINGTLTFNGIGSGPATGGNGTGTSAGSSGTSAGGTTGILPTKIVGEWWWPWNPPSIATVQSQAPEVNYLSLVGAFVNGHGGGGVTTDTGQYGSMSAMASDIAAWKARGREIVGVVGGGGDSTVIANATNVSQFMATAVPIIKQLGLQGIDFDLENTPDAASVASIVTQLKAEFGATFIVALSPRPFELRPGGVYRQVIQDAGINNIDLVQPQDYALAGYSLAAQQSYMSSDMSDWISGKTGLTIPANKILIGSFDPAEGESLATAIQTFQYYKGLYPALRGGMFWESREDASQLGWQWASQQAAAEQ